MKKAFALVLALALLLTLAACSGENKPAAPNAPEAAATPNPSTEPAPEATPAASEPDPAELWKALDGVWVHTEEGEWQNYFVWFYTEGGEYRYCLGLFASDFGELGTLSAVEKQAENEYLLIIHFPEVPESEMYEARAAFDSKILINTAGAHEQTILVTFEGSDAPVPFDLLGATVQEAGAVLGV